MRLSLLWCSCLCPESQRQCKSVLQGKHPSLVTREHILVREHILGREPKAVHVCSVGPPGDKFWKSCPSIFMVAIHSLICGPQSSEGLGWMNHHHHYIEECWVIRERQRTFDNILAWHKFWKVSALVYLLCKVTIYRTLESILAVARQEGSETKKNKNHPCRGTTWGFPLPLLGRVHVSRTGDVDISRF